MLAVAGAIGFAGSEVAARIRLRVGRRLDSPALVADGLHARLEGFVSLGVGASAAVVALGFPRGDPVIGRHHRPDPCAPRSTPGAPCVRYIRGSRLLVHRPICHTGAVMEQATKTLVVVT